MKKIIIVSSSLDNGGAQKMISNITTNLPDNIHADIVLNSDKNIQFSYKGDIVSLNIKEPKSKDRMNLFYQAKVLIKRLFVLRKLKNKDYIACISLLDSANVANILTKNKKCKTIITCVVNMTANKNISQYRYIVFPLIRFFYNKASCIVAQNKAIQDDLVENFGINKKLFSIIYNGIDGEAIQNICQKEINKEETQWFGKRTIITAGRLAYAKGQWHLIRAFSEVIKKVPDAKLVIFGEGELEDFLQKMIDDYKLNNSAKIMSFNNQLDKYISASAIFTLTSLAEGMPTALLEAMACSTACLVTDFKSGAREVMNIGSDVLINELYNADNGIIVPLCSDEIKAAEAQLEKNEYIMADAFSELLIKDELRKRIACEGKKRSLDFEMNKIIMDWIKVIES